MTVDSAGDGRHFYCPQEAQRAPSSRGLPIKTLDGELTFQHPKQRQQLKGTSEPREDGEGPAVAAPLASLMPIRVAGVTIEDDLEEHRRAEAEARRHQEAEEAKAARERKVLEQRRKAEEQEGERLPL